MSIPLQSTEVDSPLNSATSATSASSLSESFGRAEPKNLDLNSSGERSDIQLMPNTAVPLLAFSAALRLSMSFKFTSNWLNLAILSLGVAYYVSCEALRRTLDQHNTAL